MNGDTYKCSTTGKSYIKGNLEKVLIHHICTVTVMHLTDGHVTID